MLIKHIHLEQEKLCLFVGSLEATLLYALWDQDEPITMAKLYKHLVRDSVTDLSYSTIITTLNRMATKGYIQRIDREHSTPLWYKAFVDEDHFIEVAMIETLNVLRDNYSEHFDAYIGA